MSDWEKRDAAGPRRAYPVPKDTHYFRGLERQPHPSAPRTDLQDQTVRRLKGCGRRSQGGANRGIGAPMQLRFHLRSPRDPRAKGRRSEVRAAPDGRGHAPA